MCVSVCVCVCVCVCGRVGGKGYDYSGSKQNVATIITFPKKIFEQTLSVTCTPKTASAVCLRVQFCVALFVLFDQIKATSVQTRLL